MKRLMALLILMPVMAVAQVSNMPDIGQLIARSRDAAGLYTGCSLTWDRQAKLLRCLDPRLISLSFPPTSFGLGTGNAPSLTIGDPPYLTFTDSGNQTATLDWIMPSEALDGSSVLLAWEATAGSGTVVWKVDWCAYGVGQTPCAPSGAHVSTVATATMGANRATHSTVNPFDPSWEPSQRVVLHITRSSTGNSLSGDVKLTGVRVELTQE